MECRTDLKSTFFLQRMRISLIESDLLSRFLTLPLLMASVFQRFTLLLSNLSLALVNRVLRNFKDAVVIYQTVRLFVLHDNFQMFSVNELQDVFNFVYEAVLKRLIYCILRQLYST